MSFASRFKLGAGVAAAEDGERGQDALLPLQAAFVMACAICESDLQTQVISCTEGRRAAFAAAQVPPSREARRVYREYV